MNATGPGAIRRRLFRGGWEAAKQNLFLNPEPSLEDLKFFAFIGSIAAKAKWPEIQEAIRQAAADRAIAEQNAVTCNCRDYQYRGPLCKHQKSVNEMTSLPADRLGNFLR